MAIPRKAKSPVEIPLTSTSDVAFLLLIFFLVAASNMSDRGVALDLPQTNKQQDKKESQNVEIVLTNEQITFMDKPIDPSQLRDAITTKLSGVKEPGMRVVILSASPNVTYERWSKVIDDIELAGGIPAPQMEEVTEVKGNEGGGGQ